MLALPLLPMALLFSCFAPDRSGKLAADLLATMAKPPPPTPPRPLLTADQLKAMALPQLLDEALRKEGKDYRATAIKVFAERRKWADSDLRRVLDREIWIGATIDHVVLSWGKPERSSSTHYLGSTVDDWFYGSILRDGPRHHVRFTNDVCEVWSVDQ